MSPLLAAKVMEALVEHGVVPPKCRAVELLLAADGAMVLRYEVYADAPELQQLGTALLAMAERIQQARTETP